MKKSNDYSVSGIKTEEEYAIDAEPWFLNAVYKLSKATGETNVLKIDAWAIEPLGGMKGNRLALDMLLSFCGNDGLYSTFIELIVKGLTKKKLVTVSEDKTYVSITEKGIGRCNDPDRPESWNTKYYEPNEKPK